MTQPISVHGMRLCHVTGEKSDVVASFNANVGDFFVSRGAIRKRHDDGTIFVATPGGSRGSTFVRLTRGSETEAALSAAALAVYRAMAPPDEGVAFDDDATFDDGSTFDL